MPFASAGYPASAILAQKLEQPRALTNEEGDVHRLEPDAIGELQYVSKH